MLLVFEEYNDRVKNFTNLKDVVSIGFSDCTAAEDFRIKAEVLIVLNHIVKK